MFYTKKIKRNFLTRKSSTNWFAIIAIFFLIVSCTTDSVYEIEVRTLTFSLNRSFVSENDSEGNKVSIRLIGEHPEPGKITIGIYPSKDFKYGTNFTTIPDGSSGTFAVDVEKDAEFASFMVFPVNDDLLRTNKEIRFMLESYQGPSNLTNGVLNHIVQINEDDIPPYTGILAYTSFEEPDAGSSGKYTDPNRIRGEHDLLNVAGENSVAFTSTGGEIGFGSTTLGTGIERDRFGVTDYIGISGTYNVTGEETDDPTIDYEYGVGTYSEGNQGFISADTDGPVAITFDKVTIPEQYTKVNFFMDVFLIHAKWRYYDLLKISVDVEYRDGTSEKITFIDSEDLDINIFFPDLIRKKNDPWHTLGTNEFKGVLEDAKTMQVVITMDQSHDDKEMYLDNLRFVYYD